MVNPEVRISIGIRYQLIRSNRCTMALQVDESGEVVVRCPLLLPSVDADRFVADKSKWISEKQNSIRQNALYRIIHVADGANFPYLGGQLTIRIGGVSQPVCCRDELILPKTENLRRQFLLWRQEQSVALLLPRVKFYCSQLGLYPSEVKLSEASTSWGSMSRTGRMKLNAALLHYSQQETDYVIVHELCHMRHMDHSPAFYQEIEKWIPNAKQIQKELRKKGIPVIE